MKPDLEEYIEEKASKAKVHSKKCRALVKKDKLKEAIEYCKKQDIENPTCSLIAKSNNADNMRKKAKRMLGEEKWWKRRLTQKALQDYCMLPEVEAHKYSYGIPPEISAYFRKYRK